VLRRSQKGLAQVVLVQVGGDGVKFGGSGGLVERRRFAGGTLLGRHHVLSGYFSLRRRWLSGLDVRSLGDLLRLLRRQIGDP